VNSARFPVIQQKCSRVTNTPKKKFDALLKKQLKGIPQQEVDKAKAIALPIAYATLEERWVHRCRLYTHSCWCSLQLTKAGSMEVGRVGRMRTVMWRCGT
jgi:hypothetical protein